MFYATFVKYPQLQRALSESEKKDSLSVVLVIIDNQVWHSSVDVPLFGLLPNYLRTLSYPKIHAAVLLL